MICADPYVPVGSFRAYGCGRCTACCLRKKREWTGRILLEAAATPEMNSFVTLTYDQTYLPVLPRTDVQAATLNPRDFTNWLKRFREAIQPLRVRYYGCGEYGHLRNRPHYHAVVFGYPPCRRGKTLRNYLDGSHSPDCCSYCDVVRDTWSRGRIEVAPMTVNHAAYVAGYINKKMTSKGDVRLNGRFPEFARMSRMPAIGTCAVGRLAEISAGRNELDVAGEIQVSRKKYPIGRTLKRKVRVALGREPNASQEVMDQTEAQMRALFHNYALDKETEGLKRAIQRKSAPVISRLDALGEIYESKRKSNEAF